MSDLHVTRWGNGEPAVLVHGSFGWGEETWREQQALGDAYELRVVDRRGFGSTPADGRVDFDRDADDVVALLSDRPHLVGHSYGGVVCLLAAVRNPSALRSLTIIEPPALSLARGNPVVEEFISRVEDAGRAATGPSDYRTQFLRGFGFPAGHAELEGPALEAARASMSERPPWEAEIRLGPLAEKRIPTLVVRGDWSTVPESARRLGGAALHAVCDVLEERLRAERAVLPAAHNPQLLGAPFNDRLRAFWESAP